ncbi:glutamate 5-kinase [Brevibacillus centrosporus]|uniref:Glutamate 5-kinase n=1 Tax=Brevibacillus centrosporus TaxID=54910 RepID=A0A1I3ZYS5_9BACL|nr:glutamate 5-kinase [Brevibacillus centrosporus]MEC2131768.1 glutamate 5-kinase [Brevibacillus centrosporus]MED4908480.1 glutamate 5-kinase [Brevibacillus centrosporus]RNB67410.1 glutamate 5-kinase [Brevibacillus centrosporus]SFK49037.1 glutamate 5-kinase [Brevibacillus centrosporus]GED33588.1 glutamate 5-kinase [Brevibacillus centrosporus]
MKKGKMRLVVKVGSSSLAATEGGVDRNKMTLLVSAVSALREAGHQVVLVSSGAVASGYQSLGYQQRPRTLAAKQAAAAIGQSLLMQTYTQMFAAHRFSVAQILLTRSDFSHRERYQHAFQTLSLLLDKNILPIINENDTVSVAELTFGDNDMLGALVAGLVHADLYLILTDTDGLYDKDPRCNPDAKRISWLSEVTEEVEALAGGASQLGTGGMRSKLIAARTAQGLGIPSFIGKLNQPSDLLEVLHGGGNGTYVSYSPEAPAASGLPTRKQWIALHSPIRGSITIDSGAAEAVLKKRSSLLLAGVRDVAGDFEQNEVIEVYCDGSLIGRGVSRFAAEELLDYLSPAGSPRRSGTVIHRDQWTETI